MKEAKLWSIILVALVGLGACFNEPYCIVAASVWFALGVVGLFAAICCGIKRSHS